jgi:prepilin-type N-terminal cleavage/methylation domain-containing protein
MKSWSGSRGYSLIEVLATIAVLGMLLFAVGTAVTHVLDAEMTGAGRQATFRSADELAGRMSEEARSATAVFVPPTDVFGQSNTGQSGGHEVDMFRKASDGTLTYVAYRFDAGSGDVTRYDYLPGASGNQIVNSDLMAEGVTSLGAVRTSPSAIGSVVGASTIKPVNVYYGAAELEGGNGVVTVAIVAGPSGGPQQQLEVHLASRAAPTDVSVLVSAGSPPPSPGISPTPITVAFVLKAPNIEHGPFHQGDPGNNDPSGGIHLPPEAGFGTFIGNGAGETADWLDLFTIYPVVQDGTYQFRNSSGEQETVTIVCNGTSCPPFVPLPIPTTGPGVVFQTTQ